MGFGKILGLAALGVGAVAAAPFTGGGSILGAATLGASLAGAGAAAAGAGAAGAAAGVYLSRKEEEEENKKDEEIARLRKKTDKLEEELKKAINRFKGDREYFNYIISLTAIGLAMANADGEISPEEDREIKEFIGGIAGSQYPEHVKEAINSLYQNIPNINTAFSSLEKVDPENYPLIRDFLEIIMEADGRIHEAEENFITLFDYMNLMKNYKPEKEDIGDAIISQRQKEMKELPKGTISDRLLECSKSAA